MHKMFTELRYDQRMKGLFFIIAVMLAADAILDRSAITLSLVRGASAAVHGVTGSISESIFST